MYFYDKKRLDDRAVDELIGLSKGIVADNIVTEDEARFLRSWMEANVPCCQDEMVNTLYRRIQEMLIDGVFDDDEKQELLFFLKNFSGQAHPDNACYQLATTIPLNDPPPPVIFEDRIFCLTGNFAYGPRRICEDVIIERGGKTRKAISGLVDYVVVGFFGNDAWIHSSYGRKIQEAAARRTAGGKIAIISEDYWSDAAFNF